MLLMHPEGEQAWANYQKFYFSIHAFEDYLNLNRFLVSIDQYAATPDTLDKYIDREAKTLLDRELRSLSDSKARQARLAKVSAHAWIGNAAALAVILSASVTSVPWIGWCLGALLGISSIYVPDILKSREKTKYHLLLQSAVEVMKDPMIHALKSLMEQQTGRSDASASPPQ
jgi:hypothetical protein